MVYYGYYGNQAAKLSRPYHCEPSHPGWKAGDQRDSSPCEARLEAVLGVDRDVRNGFDGIKVNRRETLVSNQRDELVEHRLPDCRPRLRRANVQINGQIAADFVDLRDHPQHRARGAFLPDGNLRTQPALSPGATRPAPRLGEHCDEVLREHGFSDQEIDGLRAARAIG